MSQKGKTSWTQPAHDVQPLPSDKPSAFHQIGYRVLQVGNHGEIFCTKISQSDSCSPNTLAPTQHSWSIKYRTELSAPPPWPHLPQQRLSRAEPGTLHKPHPPPGLTHPLFRLGMPGDDSLHSTPSPATWFEGPQGCPPSPPRLYGESSETSLA